MKKMKMKTCKYCGHTWNPRIPRPKSCPACKRYFFRTQTKRNLQRTQVKSESDEIYKIEFEGEEEGDKIYKPGREVEVLNILRDANKQYEQNSEEQRRQADEWIERRIRSFKDRGL